MSFSLSFYKIIIFHNKSYGLIICISRSLYLSKCDSSGPFATRWESVEKRAKLMTQLACIGRAFSLVIISALSTRELYPNAAGSSSPSPVMERVSMESNLERRLRAIEPARCVIVVRREHLRSGRLDTCVHVCTRSGTLGTPGQPGLIYRAKRGRYMT